MIPKDNIIISISDWKKIKKEAKKKEKKEYVNIAQPPKIDVMKDSPEEIARKWKEIKQFYKDHPEVDPPWKEWEEKFQFPKLLAPLPKEYEKEFKSRFRIEKEKE